MNWDTTAMKAMNAMIAMKAINAMKVMNAMNVDLILNSLQTLLKALNLKHTKYDILLTLVNQFQRLSLNTLFPQDLLWNKKQSLA